VSPSNRPHVRPLVERLLARRRPLVVLAVAAGVEVCFLALAGTHPSPEFLLGIPGSGVALIVMLAAILAGPAVGIVCALVGAVAFFLFVAHLGATSSSFGTIGGAAIWCLAAVLAGSLANVLRRHQRSGERAAESLSRETLVREAMERIMLHAPSLHLRDSTDVGSEICRAAHEIFGSDWVRLYAVEGQEVTLVGGDPEAAMNSALAAFSLANFPNVEALVSTRRPVVLGNVEEAASGGPLLSATKHLPLRTSLIAPMVSRGRLRGLLTLSWQVGLPSLDGKLVGVAQGFADQATVALENARRREAQHQLVYLHAALEGNLIPPAFVEHASFEVVRRYRPSESRLRLGGDFLDALALDDGELALVVGDVSGHGPAAAALGASLRATWQALVMSGASPRTIRNTLDAVVVRERRTEETFATASLAWVSAIGDKVRCLNIGHPLPLLLAPRVVSLDAPPALPLGVEGNDIWSPAHFHLDGPWSLLFYTDGLIEGSAQPGGRERYGEDRLVDRLQRRPLRGEDEIDRLIADLETANGAPMADDIALLLVRKKVAA